MVSAAPRRDGVLVLLASLVTTALILGPPGASATQARPIVTKYPNIIYSFPPDGPLAMDIYRPATGSAYPGVLAIHGGSWKRGDKRDWEDAARQMARGGFVVFVANYRLAPPRGDVVYPAPVEDLRVAYNYMRENAAFFHADPKKLGIIGSSAGGHLGLLLASELGGLQGAPGAVVGLSPPTDLVRMGREGPLQAELEKFMGCSVDQCLDRYEEASPISRVKPTNPDTFLAYSSDELIPVSDGQELSDRLVEAGVSSRLVVMHGSAHALKMAKYMIPKAMRYFRHKLDGCVNGC